MAARTICCGTTHNFSASAGSFGQIRFAKFCGKAFLFRQEKFRSDVFLARVGTSGSGKAIMDNNMVGRGKQIQSSDLGIPDFEYPHILTLHERNLEGRFVMRCVCGAKHAITGLDWLQWMEQHANCETPLDA